MRPAHRRLDAAAGPAAHGDTAPSPQKQLARLPPAPATSNGPGLVPDNPVHRRAEPPALYTFERYPIHGAMEQSPWRAGFELEVILGDLRDPRFERDLEESGGMDEASPAFCRAVAKRLREWTGRTWTAPLATPLRPGFYVIPECGLDPLHWPGDRLAGVELLTPPLLLPG
jgi:hypothetical protein